MIDSNERRSIRNNVRWGLGWGLYYASGLTIIAAIPAVIRALAAPGTFGQKAISFMATIAVYFIGGATGGVVMGLLRGLLTGCLGSMLVGMVAIMPATFAACIALFGLSWTRDNLIFCIGFGCLYGAIMSSVLWLTRDRHDFGTGDEARTRRLRDRKW